MKNEDIKTASLDKKRASIQMEYHDLIFSKFNPSLTEGGTPFGTFHGYIKIVAAYALSV